VDQRSLKNIFKLLSAIGAGISIFFLLPLLTGLYYGERVAPLAWFDLLFGACNTVMFLLLRHHRMELTLKEGILSVNLVWLLLGVAGGVPLWLYSDITLMQGIFEAISGFTTTGATVYRDLESLPKMVLMLRSLMHWLGGMGILVLGVGLLSLINPSGSLALFKAEAPGIRLEKVTPKIKDTALHLWAIYLLLTVADALLLHWEGMGFFDAVNHAFSTISTGGFSTKNASLEAFATPAILWTTTFFMIISGINFLAHLKFVYGDFQGYRSEETLWYLVIFLILSSALMLVTYEKDAMPLGDAATHAFFSIASLLTTTGFASIDYEEFGPAAVVLCFAAMFIGGNGGSTAGGPKVIRYVVSAKVIGMEIKKILHPNAVVTLFIDRMPVANTLVSAVFGFMLLFALTDAAIVFYLYASGYDALTAVSAAVACVSNVGPGFGHVGPECNYADFGDLDDAVLSAGMILGRLEFYTFFLMLFPAFWKKF
jgi:trk system potassium uptake protein TrkH